MSPDDVGPLSLGVDAARIAHRRAHLADRFVEGFLTQRLQSAYVSVQTGAQWIPGDLDAALNEASALP